MEKMVLLYHFEGIRLAQAHKALEKLPFRIREVKKEEYGYPLGYLAGLPESFRWEKYMKAPSWSRKWWFLRIHRRRYRKGTGRLRSERTGWGRPEGCPYGNQSGLEFPAAVRRTEKGTCPDAWEALSI